MTKYEWESELKKNIHRLPADEIKRVMEYYDELFADKIERGYGETEIISQFGNPVDVADKIISEYDGELEADKKESAPVYESKPAKSEPQPQPEPQSQSEPQPQSEPAPEKQKKDKKAGRRFNGSALVLFIVVNVFTAFAFFIVIGSLWIAVGSVAVGGIACIGGGVLETIFSLFDVFGGHAAAGFAKAGMSIAAVGIGVVMISVIGKLFKLYGKVCGKIFAAIGNWICPKEKAND